MASIEQQFAEPEGAAAYQEEVCLPGPWFALAALPLLFALAARLRKPGGDGGTRMRMLPAVMRTAVFAAVLGYFSTLRIVVQDGTLTVGFRRLAERIPLARITACAPTTYQWLQWGGYGIRMRPHAKMYNLPSDHGHAVRLTLDDGREVFFSSADPDAVCAAIHAGQPAGTA